MKTLEFACSHNHGRSPLAQAFTENYLRMNRISGYAVKSTGTYVHLINDQLAGKATFTVDDIYFLSTKAHLRNFPTIPSPDVQLWARDLLRRFVDEEHDYRAKIFEAFSLGTPKQTHDQTFYDPQSVLVLGMGSKNTETLRQIYPQTKGIVIDSLTSYAAGRPVDDFRSAFGGTVHDYATMAREIGTLVDQSLDIFFGKK